MINFEDELKNFRPIIELEQLEEHIAKHKIVDVSDIMNEIRKDNVNRIAQMVRTEHKQENTVQNIEQRGTENEMS